MQGRFARFSQVIFEIWRSWHKIAGDELEKHGLKGVYIVYLQAMQRYADGITSSELGKICYKDKADVSRAIMAMEGKGLVRREAVGKSIYRARLFLTEEGKAFAEEINQRANLAVELGGGGLSDEQREMMYEALERISYNLRTLSQKGLPEE